MSLLPSDLPRLPKWPFLVGDAALLTVAGLSFFHSPQPLSGTPLVLITGCVALGAVLAAIPFITDYARRQDLALDERQRALEALASTTATAAEQIGIAAQGLHSIAELTQKNLRQAEQLPYKLQERIAEFQQQLATAEEDEREELERELATLREAESDRLETTVGKIHRATADWAKLEDTVRALSAIQEMLGKLPATGAATAEQLQRAITEASAQAAAELKKAGLAAEQSWQKTQVQHQRLVDEHLAAALHQLEEHCSRSTAQLAARLTSATPAPAAPPVGAHPGAPAGPAHAAAEPPATVKAAPPAVPAPPTPASKPATPAPLVPAVTPAIAVAPAPVVPAKVPPPPENPPRPVAPPAPKIAAPARPVPAPDAQPLLGLLIDPPPAHLEAKPTSEYSQTGVDEAPAPPALSADGATRLLVTAYVGIGNRLFLRGVGPGLRPDKGVPLQFISIGKWRWETADATAPVKLRLYKNDQLECAAVGELTLEPGRQAEITASF